MKDNGVQLKRKYDEKKSELKKVSFDCNKYPEPAITLRVGRNMYNNIVIVLESIQIDIERLYKSNYKNLVQLNNNQITQKCVVIYPASIHIQYSVFGRILEI